MLRSVPAPRAPRGGRDGDRVSARAHARARGLRVDRRRPAGEPSASDGQARDRDPRPRSSRHRRPRRLPRAARRGPRGRGPDPDRAPGVDRVVGLDPAPTTTSSSRSASPSAGPHARPAPSYGGLGGRSTYGTTPARRPRGPPGLVGEDEVSLTGKEFDVLTVLSAHRDKVVSRAQLMATCGARVVRLDQDPRRDHRPAPAEAGEGRLRRPRGHRARHRLPPREQLTGGRESRPHPSSRATVSCACWVIAASTARRSPVSSRSWSSPRATAGEAGLRPRGPGRYAASPPHRGQRVEPGGDQARPQLGRVGEAQHRVA